MPKQPNEICSICLEFMKKMCLNAHTWNKMYICFAIYGLINIFLQKFYVSIMFMNSIQSVFVRTCCEIESISAFIKIYQKCDNYKVFVFHFHH